MTHMWKCLQIYCNIYPFQGMQEVRRKKTLRKPVGVGKGRRHLSSTRRYVMGHAGWRWCCGGGVVVVGCAWGPARRGFFGGGCTVVGSWGVWVFARLGAARRGGFWRLRIGGPSVWHCIANQCTVKPTGHLLGDFVLLLISTFLSFSAVETNNKKEEES